VEPIKLNAFDVGACARKVVYKHLGMEPKPFTQRQKRIFKMGELLEGLILDNAPYEVVGRGYHLQVDVTYLTGIPAYFSLRQDGMASDPLDRNGDWIVEAKSMNSRAFAHAKAEGIAVSHPQYLWQVACYLKASGENDFEGVIFEILNKDNAQTWREFIEKDVLLTAWAQVEERAAYLINCITKKVLPGRSSNLPTWACLGSYCEYSHICEYGEGQREHIHHDTNPVDNIESLEEYHDFLSYCQNYMIYHQQQKEAEDQKKTAYNNIKAIMKQYGLKNVVSGGFKVTYSRYPRQSVNLDLIPPGILAEATTTKEISKISIKEVEK